MLEELWGISSRLKPEPAIWLVNIVGGRGGRKELMGKLRSKSCIERGCARKRVVGQQVANSLRHCFHDLALPLTEAGEVKLLARLPREIKKVALDFPISEVLAF
jgi:hypothetical protein